MKKLTSVIVIIILVLSLTAGSHVLSYEENDFDDCAGRLNAMGLFKGTGTGYELMRQPTRLEGAVMFVRLLGAEGDALANRYSHPFSDVPEWGDPYIGYLYERGLSNGISDTEYGTIIPMKAKSYITFALRALGYSDREPDNDFSWDGAVEYAHGMGFISDDMIASINSEDFLRGHVTVVSCELLRASMKNNDINLMEKLIVTGAVAVESAIEAGYGDAINYYGIGVFVGDSFSDAYSILGVWNQNLFSRYDFDWLVYHGNYSNYLQVGIDDDKVTALLMASEGYEYERDIRIGMYRTDVEKAYPEGPMTEIRKSVPEENMIIAYQLDNSHKHTFRTIGGDYITYYYDSYENDKVIAILVVDDVVEDRTTETFPAVADETFYKSLARQVFHLTNAVRVQKNFSVLEWEETAAQAGAGHAKDMADRDYFSHDTPEGGSFGDRLEAQGVSFVSAGENIAYGYRNPIHMINDWMNSQTGHREVMLGDFKYLGVGVWVNGEGRMYSAQEYWR